MSESKFKICQTPFHLLPTPSKRHNQMWNPSVLTIPLSSLLLDHHNRVQYGVCGIGENGFYGRWCSILQSYYGTAFSSFYRSLMPQQDGPGRVQSQPWAEQNMFVLALAVIQRGQNFLYKHFLCKFLLTPILNQHSTTHRDDADQDILSVYNLRCEPPIFRPKYAILECHMPECQPSWTLSEI